MADLISTAQAAAALGVDRRTVHRMAAAGRLPATKMPGRTGSYVFDASTIDRLLEQAKAEGLEAAQLPLFTRRYGALRPRAGATT